METVETIKDFLNELKENDTEVLNYDDFLDELKNTPERDIKGTLKTNMLSHKDGLISVDMFLDNLFTHKGQGHFLSNSEIKELEIDNTNYKYDDDWYTYKDGGYMYLTHDSHMKIFINDNDNYLVFLQFQIGLNENWGFSSYIVMKFDTKEDCEDTFFDESTDYLLSSCLAKNEDGTTLNIEVVGQPFGYPTYMYVMDNDTKKDIFSEPIFSADLDTIKDELIADYIYSDYEFTGYNGTVKIDL